MTRRVLALGSTTLFLVFAIGCSQSPQLNTITVSPTTATIPNVGGTAQFQATGYFVNGKNGNQNYQDLTHQVVWTSSVPTVATVDSSGLATAVGVGETTITATGGNGGLSATATLSVSSSPGTNNLQSIDVIPASQTVYQVGETAQYIAIGNYSGNPPTKDITNQVTWSSSDVRIATINTSGLATGVGNCGGPQTTTITALAPPSLGGEVAGTATFTTGSCETNNLPTLTVYEVGQGSGVVTSVPGGINCGSGAGCTDNFPLNSMVTLTATPNSGSLFGGFSANCTPVVPDPSSCSAKEPGVASCTCSVTMVDNQTVGAIFNRPQ